jgi:hypothetical protein
VRILARSSIAWTLLVAFGLPQVAFAQGAATPPKPSAAPKAAPAAASAPAPATATPAPAAKAAAPSAAAASAPAAAPATPPASTEPPKPLSETLTGEALAEYESASLLYRDGDYAGALTKFTHSYELAQDPRLLWNIAVCEKNLRHYANVQRLVTRYLAEGGTFLTAEDRASAEALLTAIASFVSSLTVNVNPAGAAVIVDGRLVGKSPLPEALNVDMGSHVIGAQLEGYVEQKRTIELVGGRSTDVSFELQEMRHEGKLRVFAGPREEIYIDGKIAGIGQWEGVLPSGVHRVRVTAPEKKPYESDVNVVDAEVSSVNVSLSDIEKQQSSTSPWLWILGGAAVAAGAGLGGYFLFRGPNDPKDTTTVGTISPGQVTLD